MSLRDFKESLVQEFESGELGTFEDFLVKKLNSVTDHAKRIKAALDKQRERYLQTISRPRVINIDDLDTHGNDGVYVFFRDGYISCAIDSKDENKCPSFTAQYTSRDGILGNCPQWIEEVPPHEVKCILLIDLRSLED